MNAGKLYAIRALKHLAKYAYSTLSRSTSVVSCVSLVKCTKWRFCDHVSTKYGRLEVLDLYGKSSVKIGRFKRSRTVSTSGHCERGTPWKFVTADFNE